MPVCSQIDEDFPSKGLKAGGSKASEIQSPQLLAFDDITEDISFPAASCLPLVYKFWAGVAPLWYLWENCKLSLTWCLFHKSKAGGEGREKQRERDNIFHISCYWQPFLNFLRTSGQCKNIWVFFFLRSHAVIQTKINSAKPSDLCLRLDLII